jgi:hypothetical protein
MSYDFNNQKYPHYEPEPKGEGHAEPTGGTIVLSNVLNATHPLFSSDGLIDIINKGRNLANAFEEKPIKGEVNPKIFEDVILAAKKTKMPVDLLLLMVDFEKEVTSRSDASDAETIAKKAMQYIPKLRDTFGRDPWFSEIFAAAILESADKVKKIFDDATEKPDEEAKPPGTKHDKILIKKKENEKEVKRTNKELYNYFFKRLPIGRKSFNTYISGLVNDWKI